ncbi:MAG: 3-dehydroquinate synthase [SAR86 cluster bacterium]|uniref:3-dehydroquinate synthase n=1 Tax=SAR86 cluster bacterium TaxID=2030880 RepID=A0A2A5CKH2_9GAMM|nr:3-dehydroquinate synthase [Gammaproteobacteria bacterium AH-315-E17]PCJ43866.1 MAG: 3-dehydroquinate synthase [SAR86 cluster bacterium]
MTTVVVELGDRSYPIHIGSGLLSNRELLIPHIKGKQVCIITNDVVAPLYLEKLKTTLTGFELSEFILPDGEAEKTLDNIAKIYDALLSDRLDRNVTLIALGGGVVGDMAGFAAATYLRGVNFIQVPTTLLAQVDSSVGGKTGVNRPLGKNMVGAFYQPQCVIADTDTLNTLPDKELSAGLAEVIKYGLINNLEFFNWLEANINNLAARNEDSLVQAIKMSCEEKAAIVSADEKETGIRVILNLGHTFGHAIEAAMGYGSWLHGEAVATGMLMAADLSCRMRKLSVEDVARIKALLIAAGLPVVPPEAITKSEYLSLMSRDKKNVEGSIRFVLLEKLGKALVTSDVDPLLLDQTLQAGTKLGERLGEAPSALT